MLAPEVFITCAVTGSADSVRKNPNVPVTPVEIAASALEAHADPVRRLSVPAQVPQNVLWTRSPGCGGSA
jgi:beta-keto acid cleavage enzyme